MIDFLQQWFSDNWRPEFGAARPGSIRLVKTASSGAGLRHKERESKIFFMAFSARATRPFAVAKIPRFQHGLATLRREYGTLSEVAACEALAPTFADTVPSPLYFGEIGPETVSVQTAVHGRMVRGARGRAADREYGRVFAMARQWQRGMAPFAASGGVTLTGEHIHNWFVQPLDVINRATRMAGVQAPDMLRDILHEADALQGQAVTAVAQHGDFTVSNVCVEGAALRVFDFEHFAIENNPLFDVIWFARSLWHASCGPEWIESPAASAVLKQAAADILGERAHELARPLFTQALLKSFARKFAFLGATADAAGSMVPPYLREMEALRGVFAA